MPPRFTVTFDMRLGIDVDHQEFEKQLNEWCKEAGGNIDIIFEIKQSYIAPTKIDESNTYFTAFKKALDEL